MKAGGGLKAIAYSLKVASQVGVTKFSRSVLSKNACKTCALGMGGQQGGMRNETGHFPEVCKKSLQAQLTDIQPEIAPEVFAKTAISELRRMRGRELERLGRLNYPLLKNEGDTHYRVIGWDEALERIVTVFRATKPDRTFFYSSGRSSNEAAFLLQLFVRLYGTNNINNCSYYCHQASGVGLNTTVGTGTATIQLHDLQGSDCIFVIGANPASNHPRFIRELLLCRRRGGHVIVINPARELGLVKFAVPSDVRSMLSGGSEIASEYIQPHIGGDIALLKGIAKVVLERGSEDRNFLADHTNGAQEYIDDIRATAWEEIVNASGVPRELIERVGEKYAQASNVVFSWAMGITHHIHGSENVESIANLALLRGMVGKPYAGLAPIRGHSNVQGIGSVGVTPTLKRQIFDNIRDKLGVQLPTTPGMDTMACMRAADNGAIDAALLLGGNLYGSNPDSVFAGAALDKIPFKVFLNTTLNLGHFYGCEKETLILPVAARDEEKQSTTQESMFNFVRLSDGGIVRLHNVRSEVDIIADIAAAVVPDCGLDFQAFKEHANIRKAIAATVPGFEDLERIGETKKEFQIRGRTFHAPEFATPDKKANFRVVSIPDLLSNDPQALRLMTVRSEGQFNTIVYDEEDTYRGQTDRWVILMNKKDIARLGLRHNGKANVSSSTGSMRNVTVREFDISAGNCMGYYPEANELVSAEVDNRSKTPAFKSVPVRVESV